MPRFYLDLDQARGYPELRPLLAVESLELEEYVAPFTDLMRSGFLARVISEALGLLRSSTERFGGSTSELDWLLLRTPRFSLGLRTTPRQAETFAGLNLPRPLLVALPNDVMMGFVGHGTAEVELFRSAFPRDQDVFRTDHHLERLGCREVRDGSILELRAGDDVARFTRTDERLAVLELAILAPRRLVWNYDPDTLQARHAASASVEATRTEFAIELFERFAYIEAVPNLLALGRSSPQHWVRWRALTAALKLDLRQSLGSLRAATQDDPHPHVRNAARATLDNLERAGLGAGD
ncbi:MAG: hypothetical protein ABMA64_09955 [Myxococcota bacterium]